MSSDETHIAGDPRCDSGRAVEISRHKANPPSVRTRGASDPASVCQLVRARSATAGAANTRNAPTSTSLGRRENGSAKAEKRIEVRFPEVTEGPIADCARDGNGSSKRLEDPERIHHPRSPHVQRSSPLCNLIAYAAGAAHKPLINSYDPRPASPATNFTHQSAPTLARMFASTAVRPAVSEVLP